MQLRLLKPSWTEPTIVLCLWIPAACCVFLIGFLASLALSLAGRAFTLEDAIISDLLSPENNPRGYLFAAIATSAAGLLLLPAAALFEKGWGQTHLRLAMLGAWLYRISLVATIVIGISTPFQTPYIPVHVWLAYFGYTSAAAGLAVCLSLAARSSAPARVPLGMLAALQTGALLYLVYEFFGPNDFLGSRWFLSFCEWALCALIAAGTAAAAAASNAAPIRAERACER
jgi:hypothetical protein